MKKRILGILLCLCMVAGALPANALAATAVATVRLTVEKPVAGGYPSTTASVPSTASTEVIYVQWEGDFDENGCFIEGETYTVEIHVGIKAGLDKVFAEMAAPLHAYINGSKNWSKVERMTDDYIIVSEKFKAGKKAAEPTETPDTSLEDEENLKEVTSITWFGRVFSLEPGQKPQLRDLEKEITVGMEGRGFYVDSISYTPDGPCKPYTRVTATVVYKAKEGYKFSKTVQNNSLYKQSITWIDSKTVKIVYIGFVESDGTDLVSQVMLDYGKSHKKAPESAYAVVATGKLCDVENSDKLKILNWPSMCSKRFDGKEVYDTKKGKLTKTIKILDLHAERRFVGVVGEWYLVSCANVVGFIPAAYVDDVKVIDYWAGAPGKPSESVPVFAGGSGTVEDPYLIETAEQLDAVRRGLNCSYKLIADIDLSNWGNWVPIGSNPAYGMSGSGDAQKEASAFHGTFDGDGHVISGMTIIDYRDDLFMTSPGTDRVYGLFAQFHCVDSETSWQKAEPRLKNLGIVNYTIDLYYPNMTQDFNLYVAPFFWRGSYTSMDNCYSAGGNIRVRYGGNGGRVQVSGLIGEMHGAKITNCYNTSSITVTDLDNKDRKDFNIVWATGLCNNVDYVWFVNCFNSGDITVSYASGSGSIAAGLINRAVVPELRGIIGAKPEGSSALYHCYNSGNITGSCAYGLSGISPVELYIDDCYNVGKLTVGTDGQMGSATDTGEYTAPGSAILRHGNTYLSKKNGVSKVSGDMWKNSAKLGRKVLKVHPEDEVKVPKKAEAVLMYECDIKDIPKQTYSGKAQKPAVTVSYKGKTLVEGTDYTVAYSKNVDTGRAVATVYGMGVYKGTVGKSFAIVPAKAKGLTGSSKGAKTATLNWRKSDNATGYIIEYSLDKDFKDVKKVTVTSKNTLTQRVSGLTSGKTYYFRICAYKTVSGKKATGPYSDVITVEVK